MPKPIWNSAERCGDGRQGRVKDGGIEQFHQGRHRHGQGDTVLAEAYPFWSVLCRHGAEYAVSRGETPEKGLWQVCCRPLLACNPGQGAITIQASVPDEDFSN